MQKDLKQRYEKLVKCQDHIKINIEKYDHYQCREDMTYLDSDGKEWLLESRENMTFAVEKWVEQFQKATSSHCISGKNAGKISRQCHYYL